MLTEETMLPVYFAVESDEIEEIYSHVKSSANGKFDLYVVSISLRYWGTVIQQ